jgi:uncharacterized membrane protein
MLLRFGVATILLAPILFAGVAQAETIPKEYLEADRAQCNESCTKENHPAQWCARYCDCTMKKMKAQITFEEYGAVSTAAVEDTPQPPNPLDKLSALATSCREETK